MFGPSKNELLMKNKSWYHGVLSQQEAERRMGEMDMNSFLVRKNMQDLGNFILSVKNGDMCYHFPIDDGVGRYEIQGTHLPFSISTYAGRLLHSKWC